MDSREALRALVGSLGGILRWHLTTSSYVARQQMLSHQLVQQHIHAHIFTGEAIGG